MSSSEDLAANNCSRRQKSYQVTLPQNYGTTDMEFGEPGSVGGEFRYTHTCPDYIAGVYIVPGMG